MQKDLFGYEKPVIEHGDSLVCIKCDIEQPIDQFNAMKYASSGEENKQTEIKRTSSRIKCSLSKLNSPPKVCQIFLVKIRFYNLTKSYRSDRKMIGRKTCA